MKRTSFDCAALATTLAAALALSIGSAGTAAAQTAQPAVAPPAPAASTPAPAPVGENASSIVTPGVSEPPATGETTAPAVIPETAPVPAPLELTAETEEKPPAKVGYEKGFFIESGDGNHRVVIGSRVQVRYVYDSIENGVDQTSFSVFRARLKLDGHTFTKDLTYMFQTEFGSGAVSMKDYFADYRLVPELLHVRAGQWTRPFSRQQITSDGSQQLVDRTITDKAFGGGRDIGIALHNNYEKSPEFEYAIGLFNGTGEKSTQSVAVDPTTGEGSAAVPTNIPVKLHPALVAHVGYNYGGLKGYSEVDLEGGPLRFGIGGAGYFGFDADRNNDSIVRGQLDAIVKAHGFSTTGAVYVSSVQAGQGFGDRAFGALGFHLQAGYLIAEHFEPAVRVAIVAPDGNNNDERELSLGLNWFPFGHTVAWQTDIAAISAQATDTTNARLRTQLQVGF